MGEKDIYVASTLASYSSSHHFSLGFLIVHSSTVSYFKGFGESRVKIISSKEGGVGYLHWGLPS